jgi:hypothetical protein
MDEGGIFVLSIVIPLTVIVGGCVLIGLAIYRVTRLKELAMRERLALIEKGLMPSPERDPARFEEIMRGGSPPGLAAERGNRMRTLGVLLVGVGAGLALLIGVAGEDPASGIGVGGGIAILGAAFLVSGLMSARSPGMRRPPVSPDQPAGQSGLEP